MARKGATKRPGLVGPLIRIAGAAALGAAISNKKQLADADEQARAQIHGRRSETLDRSLPALTDLGSTYAIAGASAVLFAMGKRTLARDVLGAGAVAWVASQGAKPMFRRPRPYDAGAVDILVRRPAGQSYPSGHPAVAAAVARVLEPQVRAPARALVARIPKIVAFSRVYVGVHYPTDVIGGMMIGRAVADLWLRYTSRR